MTDLSMNEALSGNAKPPVLDAQGALIDADMGAYYTWIDLMRLTGASQSAFLVWFENHTEALAVAPSMAPGSTSGAAISLQDLLKKLSV
jgi:hypothetical protein